MIFIGYTRVNFDIDDDDVSIYSTSFKCMIVPEIEDVDIDNTSESVRIYVNNGGDVDDEINIYRQDGSESTTQAFSGAAIVPSGRTIRGEAINENSFQGTLHIFRLPENP